MKSIKFASPMPSEANKPSPEAYIHSLDRSWRCPCQCMYVRGNKTLCRLIHTTDERQSRLSNVHAAAAAVQRSKTSIDSSERAKFMCRGAEEGTRRGRRRRRRRRRCLDRSLANSGPILHTPQRLSEPTEDTHRY